MIADDDDENCRIRVEACDFDGPGGHGRVLTTPVGTQAQQHPTVAIPTSAACRYTCRRRRRRRWRLDIFVWVKLLESY
jgi:hypothetical protein